MDGSVRLKAQGDFPGKLPSCVAFLLQRDLFNQGPVMSCQGTSSPVAAGCCTSLWNKLWFKGKKKYKMLRQQLSVWIDWPIRSKVYWTVCKGYKLLNRYNRYNIIPIKYKFLNRYNIL